MAKPKLALIPAAQGDKFYSVLPSDGVGDFDFTRNSSATRIAPTGFIQEVGAFGSELVTNGNFDNDSDWTKTNVTIANGVATFVTGTASLQQAISITVGKTYKITYQINGGTGTLNLSSSGFTNVSTVIPSTVGTHIINATAVNTNNLYLVCIGSSNLVIDNVSVVEVVGNKSRLNYDLLNGKVVNCPHYLLEPARTNLVTYSEDFSNAAWTKSNSSITSNSVISPDGTLNADKLVINTSLGYLAGTFISSGNTDVTVSFFVKSDTLSSFTFVESFYFGTITSFDLSIGTTDNGKIENYGNGWYRCSKTYTYASGQQIVAVQIKTGAIGSIYLYGGQFEQGSYATSYIPTNGTAITRAAESADGSGDAATFNDSEGVLMLEISALANDLSDKRISLNDGSVSNVVRIGYTTTSNQIIAVVYNGANQAILGYSNANITLNNKVLVKYKTNDFALWINGFELDTDTSGSTFSEGTLTNINFDGGSGGNDWYGKTRELQYFDSALTDSQLETLTSWTSLQEMITSQLYTNY